MAELDDEERELFLEELGIKESGLDKLIRASYRLLGRDELFDGRGGRNPAPGRFRSAQKRPRPAGKIHTDFERGFIKAEVVNYKDLLELRFPGGLPGKKALVGMEGKEYVVQDGDVILFRFNV